METMFDTLLQLPLFQGLCHEDFTNILEKVKLHFSKYKAGDTIIKRGATCEQLCFLLKGEMSITTSSLDDTCTFIEQIEAPFLIEPHSLFGMNTSYISTYIAHSNVHTVSISKEFVLNELFNYEIFRLNYMNVISSRAQNLHARLWKELPTQDLKEKLVRFILLRCERLQGSKNIKIKKNDLAHYLDDTRLNTSKVLNELQDKGLIELRRKEILIYSAEKLQADLLKK